MLDLKQALDIAVMTSMMLILCSFEAVAQDEQNENTRQRSNWGIGLGLIAERSPIKDVGAEYQVIPFVTYESKRFFLERTHLRISFDTNIRD